MNIQSQVPDTRSVEQARLLEQCRQALIAQIKANDEQRRALERALAELAAAKAATCRLRVALKRVFDEINDEGDDCDEECTTESCSWMNASDALSTAAPCPHDAEVKRLRPEMIQLSRDRAEYKSIAEEAQRDNKELLVEVKRLREVCGEVALNIESISHRVQDDDDLRTVMHIATRKLRAAAEGRKP